MNNNNNNKSRHKNCDKLHFAFTNKNNNRPLLDTAAEPRMSQKPVDIQGDSGGICSTLGNDSMCDSKQKSSYEHGSDFERLPRYGKKKIRTILRARTAIT